VSDRNDDSDARQTNVFAFARTAADLRSHLATWPRWRRRLRAALLRGLYPFVWLKHRCVSSPCVLRVVLYHHVMADQKEHFRRHLRYLSETFEIVDIERFLVLLSGREALRGRSKLLVTFDDGFRDNLTHAVPVLDAFDVKAVFFVTTDFVSLSPDDVSAHRRWAREVFHTGTPVANMTWENVTTLAAQGHTIGSHTVGHRRLSGLTADEVTRELVASRRVLEEKLGREVRDLSFPYGRVGDYPSDLGERVREAGFRTCFNMIRGANRPGQDPHFIYRDAFEADWPLHQVRFFMMRSGRAAG